MGRFACSVALILSISSAPLSAAAYSSVEVEAAAARVIKSRDIQAELPQPENSSDWSISLPGLNTGTWFMWAVVAAGVAVVLWPLRDQFFWGRLREPEDWSASAQNAEVRQDIQLIQGLAQAEEIAAGGRYREAMHLLLLRALHEMRQRLEGSIADSLTSREILSTTRLPEVPRAALQDLIERVERSLFGEYPAGADDYGACRASYNALYHSLYGSSYS